MAEAEAPTGTLVSMADDDLKALVEQCRREERRSRDEGRKREWIQLRQDAENELARRRTHA